MINEFSVLFCSLYIKFINLTLNVYIIMIMFCFTWECCIGTTSAFPCRCWTSTTLQTTSCRKATHASSCSRCRDTRASWCSVRNLSTPSTSASRLTRMTTLVWRSRARMRVLLKQVTTQMTSSRSTQMARSLIWTTAYNSFTGLDIPSGTSEHFGKCNFSQKNILACQHV